MKINHTRQAAAYSSPTFPWSESEAVYRVAARKDHLAIKVREAIRVLDDALDRYPYAKLENREGGHLTTAQIGYPGPKFQRGDMAGTVLIHLLCAVVLKRLSAKSLPPINSVYVRCNSPFPQVEAFIEASSEYYNLKSDEISGSMREALTEYKRRHPNIQAVVVGTRRTDPHGAKLDYFTQTDSHWPQLMRIHPIINWTYADVWAFLRCTDFENGTGVPYCNLYDYGYTSLGSTHDTYPNPQLRSNDEAALWKPAYMLQDESSERDGRGQPAKQNGELRSP